MWVFSILFRNNEVESMYIFTLFMSETVHFCFPPPQQFQLLKCPCFFSYDHKLPQQKALPGMLFSLHFNMILLFDSENVSWDHDQFTTTCIQFHNFFRAVHNSPALQWDKRLEESSQGLANYLNTVQVSVRTIG